MPCLGIFPDLTKIHSFDILLRVIIFKSLPFLAHSNLQQISPQLQEKTEVLFLFPHSITKSALNFWQSEHFLSLTAFLINTSTSAHTEEILRPQVLRMSGNCSREQKEEQDKKCWQSDQATALPCCKQPCRAATHAEHKLPAWKPQPATLKEFKLFHTETFLPSVRGE